MSQRIFFCLGILLFLFSCQPREERKVDRAFYYWKSTFKMDSSEMAALDSLKVKTLYVKFFDVVWSDIHRAMPVAVIQRYAFYPEKFKIIPVVYITNEAIEKSREEEMDLLSIRIKEKVKRMLSYRGDEDPHEIQLDCDWNASTQKKYFALLRKLKQECNGIKISATIRLHQVKYYNKTGVPPVDKGMLMFYNVSPVYKPEVRNSILDTKVASRYVSDTSRYPLELDFALPIFTWGVVFRGNTFKGLINYLDKEKMERMKFFIPLKEFENVFQTNVDTVYGDFYFRKGDVIRLEEVAPETIEEAKEILSPLIRKDQVCITLFHWDSSLVNKFDHEAIHKIFRSYK